MRCGKLSRRVKRTPAKLPISLACFGSIQSQTVREHMLEFLGGADLEKATAAYIAGNDGSSDFGELAPPVYLPQYLGAGLEIDRPLWIKIR